MKYRVIERFRGKYSIEAMCKVFGVSRSGYYDWRNRQDKPNKDQWLIDLITQAQIASKQTYGHRRIQRWLLRKHKKYVNLKVILRIMRRYDLLSKIRRVRPYMQYQKALHKYPNLLNRQFEQVSPNRFWVTDITYISYQSHFCYLSTILDAYTKQILAYELSESLEVDFVLHTVEKLVEQHGVALTTETLIHSDQGCHYTSRAFIDALKDANFIQSMSAKGVCWDNAPQESFFGHMKDEIADEISKCACFAAVKETVDDWMDYYNNDRYQWDLLKLSPKEYYTYTQTGVYPLMKFKP